MEMHFAWSVIDSKKIHHIVNVIHNIKKLEILSTHEHENKDANYDTTKMN